MCFSPPAPRLFVLSGLPRLFTAPVSVWLGQIIKSDGSSCCHPFVFGQISYLEELKRRQGKVGPEGGREEGEGEGRGAESRGTMACGETGAIVVEGHGGRRRRARPNAWVFHK